MKHTLTLVLDSVDMFDTIDFEKADDTAKRLNGTVYSWKTTGKSNWLEKGYRSVDTIGLAILPAVLPESIEMLDDEAEEGVGCICGCPCCDDS